MGTANNAKPTPAKRDLRGEEYSLSEQQTNKQIKNTAHRRGEAIDYHLANRVFFFFQKLCQLNGMDAGERRNKLRLCSYLVRLNFK